MTSLTRTCNATSARIPPLYTPVFGRHKLLVWQHLTLVASSHQLGLMRVQSSSMFKLTSALSGCPFDHRFEIDVHTAPRTEMLYRLGYIVVFDDESCSEV